VKATGDPSGRRNLDSLGALALAFAFSAADVSRVRDGCHDGRSADDVAEQAKFFAENARCIRVVNDVLAEEEIVFNDMPTPQYGQIERATSAPSIRACSARVFSDIDSRPVPSSRWMIC
jgi:hypothetical protein